ncbi:hypothetical protein GOP47_0029550 [Adiantum capillus-veneris]|nr:hypothetical protein GOP47_0029550 [Adiantum capillus-veneris]
MIMASIGSVSTVSDDKFRMSSEGTAVSAMVMEMGLVNKEVFQGSIQASASEAQKAQCECCNLVEECTPEYIAQVQGLYYGRWICGLCAEAVKEEHRRGGGGGSRKEGLEDALMEHMSVCMKFNRPERVGSPVADISAAVRRMLRRNTEVRFTSRSAPSSPSRRAPISRANSCFGAFPPGSEAPV